MPDDIRQPAAAPETNQWEVESSVPLSDFKTASEVPASDWQVESRAPLEMPSSLKAPENWRDVLRAPSQFGSFLGETAANIPSSAANFAGSAAHAVMHPVETARNMARVGLGVTEKAGITSGHDHEKYADAVGSFFADRYGGRDQFMKTLHDDPVGVAADMSALFGGGETALARVPGMAKAAEAAGEMSRGLDPVRAAGAVVAPVARGAGELAVQALGAHTHVGPESVRIAARAGREGGEAGEAFRENMRGNAAMEDPVNEAKQAVNNLKAQKQADYISDMQGIRGDKTVLTNAWPDIAQSLRKIGDVSTFKGQVIKPSTNAMREKIANTILDWYKLDPAEYHTAIGFDALKQKIGDLRDSTQYGTPDRLVADKAYHAIRDAIVNHDPTYAKAMAGYEKASDVIREIERTLSTNPKATVDTQLRKLQSVLRDNVNTSFGRRAELAKYLVDNGAPNLMERLAGQAMKTVKPRGLGVLQAGGEIAGAIAALAAGNPAVFAALMGTAATSSPRLVGEAAYYAGKLSKYFPGVATTSAMSHPAFQAGRLGQPLEEAESAPTPQHGPFEIKAGMSVNDAIKAYGPGATVKLPDGRLKVLPKEPLRLTVHPQQQ